jgi:hypothetical protein
MYDRATNLHECDVYLSGRSLRSLTPDPSQRQVTMPHPTRTRQRHRGPCTVATRACSRRPATSGRHVVSFHGNTMVAASTTAPTVRSLIDRYDISWLRQFKSQTRAWIALSS